MSISAFIQDDGYTQSAYIESVPRVYPAARIAFRPVPYGEQNAVMELIRSAAKKGSSSGADRVIISTLADRIQSWEFFDDEGNRCDSPPVSEQSVSQLRPKLLLRLVDIVIYGEEGGDKDPQGGADPKGYRETLGDDQKN